MAIIMDFITQDDCKLTLDVIEENRKLKIYLRIAVLNQKEADTKKIILKNEILTVLRCGKFIYSDYTVCEKNRTGMVLTYEQYELFLKNYLTQFNNNHPLVMIKYKFQASKTITLTEPALAKFLQCLIAETSHAKNINSYQEFENNFAKIPSTLTEGPQLSFLPSSAIFHQQTISRPLQQSPNLSIISSTESLETKKIRAALDNIFNDLFETDRYAKPLWGIWVKNENGHTIYRHTHTTNRIYQLALKAKADENTSTDNLSKLLIQIKQIIGQKEAKYACYTNWSNPEKHLIHSQFLDWLLKDIAQEQWHIKYLPWGGKQINIKYKNAENSYCTTKIYVPDHIAMICNIINQIGKKYTSEDATARVLAIVDREANQYSDVNSIPVDSKRSVQTQQKYLEYANLDPKRYPAIREHLTYKFILDWLKRDIASTQWQDHIKYNLWGAGTHIAFNYYDKESKQQKFNGLVPDTIGEVYKIFNQVGEKYTYKEAVIKINDVIQSQASDFKIVEVKPINFGRTDFTQYKYDIYAKYLRRQIKALESNPIKDKQLNPKLFA